MRDGPSGSTGAGRQDVPRRGPPIRNTARRASRRGPCAGSAVSSTASGAAAVHALGAQRRDARAASRSAAPPAAQPRSAASALHGWSPKTVSADIALPLPPARAAPAAAAASRSWHRARAARAASVIRLSNLLSLYASTSAGRFAARHCIASCIRPPRCRVPESGLSRAGRWDDGT